jgi:hypothetical protein
LFIGDPGGISLRRFSVVEALRFQRRGLGPRFQRFFARRSARRRVHTTSD